MNFKEYYQHYLTLHQNRWCRRLHVVGQIATIVFVVVCVAYSLWPLLLATPFIVYPFAWTGHYVFEKNEPAAFSNPLWAKACDWVMLKDIIIGKIKL
tara:strand:- start:12 stop:302 length:291 start_codon:yes stop_codon:yes gene_type:complete